MDEDILELKRQLVHLLNGSAIAAGIYLLKPVVGLWILSPLIIALITLHLLPKVRPDHKVMNHLMNHFERKKDILVFPFRGAIFFGWGIMFPIILLDAPYAAAVVLILSVGDSVSTLVGRRYGKIRIGDKSLEGSVAFLVCAWAASSILIDPTHALVLSVVGMIIELFSFADDNIVIPASLSLLARITSP